MISPNKKFIFIHIPKTAGTSIEKTLKDESCIYKSNQWGSFNAPLNHLTLNQIISSKLPPHINLKEYFKFTFVRNPWDKVISECFCPHIQLIFKDCKTISEKIKKVCSLSATGYGNHCRNQLAFVSADLPMDFIGKFENLQEDFNFVCHQLGINHQELPIKNKSNHKHYTEYYNDETKDIIANTYAEDIEHFGYEFGE